MTDMEMQASPTLSVSPKNSPSFNNYSSGRLAEIAARVIEEFRGESGSHDDIYETWPQENQLQKQVINEEDNDDDDDFEFAFVCEELETSPISADEIFYNGQIRPTHPLFNTYLLDHIGKNVDSTSSDHIGKNVDSTSSESKPRPRQRLPLRKLMMSEEREASSCSSSEADALEGVTPGTYGLWRAKGGSSRNIEQESPGSCKKSNSTGSSKRWKLRGRLCRGNSDGKDTFAFLAPSKRDKTCNADVNKDMEIPHKFKKAEDHCGSNKDTRQMTFLPYRQDLLGIFSNINGFSRSFYPF